MAYSHIILARWGKYFSQSFNEKGFSDVRHREKHTPITQVI